METKRKTFEEFAQDAVRLRAQAEAVKAEIAAWKSSLAVFDRVAADAASMLAAPFSTPPANEDEAVVFLDARTLATGRVKQARELRAMWDSEARSQGMHSLLQTKLSGILTALARAEAMSDPDQPAKAAQAIRDRGNLSAMSGSRFDG